MSHNIKAKNIGIGSKVHRYDNRLKTGIVIGHSNHCDDVLVVEWDEVLFFNSMRIEAMNANDVIVIL